VDRGFSQRDSFGGIPFSPLKNPPGGFCFFFRKSAKEFRRIRKISNKEQRYAIYDVNIHFLIH